MSTVLIRDAKLSDAPRLLEILRLLRKKKHRPSPFEYNVPSLEEIPTPAITDLPPP